MLDKTRKQKKSYVLLIICKRKTLKKTKKSRCQQADFTSLFFTAWKKIKESLKNVSSRVKK